MDNINSLLAKMEQIQEQISTKENEIKELTEQYLRFQRELAVLTRR